MWLHSTVPHAVTAWCLIKDRDNFTFALPEYHRRNFRRNVQCSTCWVGQVKVGIPIFIMFMTSAEQVLEVEQNQAPPVTDTPQLQYFKLCSSKPVQFWTMWRSNNIFAMHWIFTFGNESILRWSQQRNTAGWQHRWWTQSCCGWLCFIVLGFEFQLACIVYPYTVVHLCTEFQLAQNLAFTRSSRM